MNWSSVAVRSAALRRSAWDQTGDPRGPSQAFPAPFCLVVILRVKIDRSEGGQDSLLLVTPYIFFQSSRHSLFLGPMAAPAPGFFDELIVNRQLGCHLYSLTHQHLQHGQHLSTIKPGDGFPPSGL